MLVEKTTFTNIKLPVKSSSIAEKWPYFVHSEEIENELLMVLAV